MPDTADRTVDAVVMLSPAAGRWTADLITGRMKPEENPLRLSRFEEGVSVALGALLRGRH